jgi:hypothetical protein
MINQGRVPTSLFFLKKISNHAQSNPKYFHNHGFHPLFFNDSHRFQWAAKRAYCYGRHAQNL